MIRANRVVATLMCILALTACATSRAINISAPPALTPKDYLVFKYGGSTVELHSPVFSRDSVSGVPWQSGAACCGRQVFALSGVSEVTLMHKAGNGNVAGIGAIGIMLALLFAMKADRS